LHCWILPCWQKKIKKWIYLCHKGERHIQTSPTPSLNISFLLSTSAILEFSELFYSVSPPFTRNSSELEFVDLIY
jgi:hypothetical protein